MNLSCVSSRFPAALHNSLCPILATKTVTWLLISQLLFSSLDFAGHQNLSHRFAFGHKATTSPDFPVRRCVTCTFTHGKPSYHLPLCRCYQRCPLTF